MYLFNLQKQLWPTNAWLDVQIGLGLSDSVITKVDLVKVNLCGEILQVACEFLACLIAINLKLTMHPIRTYKCL